MKARSHAELRKLLERVLAANESRCLGDALDRAIVLRELLLALA